MFGGGYKKDDGLPAISTANIFSALESRRRKSNKKKLDKNAAGVKDTQPEQDQIWVPSPVTVKSWADVEDDDDYFATSEPLPSIWGQQSEAKPPVEESEGEDDVDEEAEEEVEEVEEDKGVNSETAAAAAAAAAASSSTLDPQERPQTPTVHREPDKQLSKKELKKKELAELDAVLAEFGLAAEKNVDNGLAVDKEDHVEVVPDGDDAAESEKPTISKRRKAKKEKPKDVDAESTQAIIIMEEIESNVNGVGDPKEVMKKLAGPKKKKTMKENSNGASKVAAEAAARAAKLAAAKKKDSKAHYNQQPAR